MKIKAVLSMIVAITSCIIHAQTNRFNFIKPNLINKQAPQFTAQAVFPDGTIGHFSLENYQGTNVVLYFYPMDNTPGCTIQAKKFRDGIEKLKKAGITVIGISCDSIKSHINFQKKHALPFALVSDSRLTRSISKAYGAAGFLYSQRKTFLINKDGIVFRQFNKVDIQNQIDDILHSFAEQKNN